MIRTRADWKRVQRDFSVRFSTPGQVMADTRIRLPHGFSYWRECGFRPETATEIVVLPGLLETTPYPRHVLKELGYALAPGGRLQVQYALTRDHFGLGQRLRALGLFMMEVGLSLGNVCRVTAFQKDESLATVTLEKTRPSLGEGDHIGKWSFGIVSSGSPVSCANIERAIAEITALRLEAVEILLCGPADKLAGFKGQATVLDDRDLAGPRPPICHKKNRLLAAAQHANMVVQHDRIFFHPDWAAQVAQRGNHFEWFCPTILDDGTKSQRLQDWVACIGHLNDYRHGYGALLPRQQWRPELYADGGLIIGKRDVLRDPPFDERLYWGETEDVVFARAHDLAGHLLTGREEVVNYTLTHRHKPVPQWRQDVYRWRRELKRRVWG